MGRETSQMDLGYRTRRKGQETFPILGKMMIIHDWLADFLNTSSSGHKYFWGSGMQHPLKSPLQVGTHLKQYSNQHVPESQGTESVILIVISGPAERASEKVHSFHLCVTRT